VGEDDVHEVLEEDMLAAAELPYFRFGEDNRVRIDHENIGRLSE
jgi:hypothetical protein